MNTINFIFICKELVWHNTASDFKVPKGELVAVFSVSFNFSFVVAVRRWLHFFCKAVLHCEICLGGMH
jgi:hypothetical protein